MTGFRCVKILLNQKDGNEIKEQFLFRIKIIFYCVISVLFYIESNEYEPCTPKVTEGDSLTPATFSARH